MVGNDSVNRVAEFVLALGAVFGMTGTFVARPDLQALLWAIDSSGLVVAAALLALNHTLLNFPLRNATSRDPPSISARAWALSPPVVAAPSSEANR